MARTNLTLKDKALWKWAKMRALELGYNGVSEYLFYLIKKEKEKLAKGIKNDACFEDRHYN